MFLGDLAVSGYLRAMGRTPGWRATRMPLAVAVRLAKGWRAVGDWPCEGDFDDIVAEGVGNEVGADECCGDHYR